MQRQGMPHGRTTPPSFRDGPKDQTRNLEIPGSCFARPGMTSSLLQILLHLRAQPIAEIGARQAEGAETDSDAVELYQLGCEYAQGFAFGEPMDADAAMRLLTEERLEAAS